MIQRLLKLFGKEKKRAQTPRKPTLHKIETETFGSHYGSWTIPKGVINQGSVCYLAGAGEDISFDVALVENLDCAVHIFDPTPRAKLHFDKLISDTEKGIPFAINQSSEEFYQISKSKLDRLNFHAIGLWDQKCTLKFFSPKNKDHVSHSALNLQQTHDYFEAQCSDLKSIMQQLNHSKIDLLKIDIEGSEYKVIESILRDRISVNVLCVEFDEIHQPLDEKYADRIENIIEKLKNYGLLPVHIDTNFNTTFVSKTLI